VWRSRKREKEKGGYRLVRACFGPWWAAERGGGGRGRFGGQPLGDDRGKKRKKKGIGSISIAPVSRLAGRGRERKKNSSRVIPIGIPLEGRKKKAAACLISSRSRWGGRKRRKKKASFCHSGDRRQGKQGGGERRRERHGVVEEGGGVRRRGREEWTESFKRPDWWKEKKAVHRGERKGRERVQTQSLIDYRTLPTRQRGKEGGEREKRKIER